MHDRLIEFLKKRNIAEIEIIARICSCFKYKKAKRNSFLVNYHEIAQDYFFIIKGSIRIYTINEEGDENSRYFAFAGELVTALPSFIDQKPALEYMQCLENCELLSITRSDFYKLTEEIPQFAIIYTTKLEVGFITAQKRIYGFQGFNALQKIQWMMDNEPQLLQKVSGKILATYLGISASTLSRVKSKLL